MKSFGFPPQIRFIIANEGAERFSFYGMKNILTFFMIHYLLVKDVPNQALREGVASSNYHLFVSAVYFFPLLGGYVSDRFLGKYKTILYLSIVYCFGHFCLALFEQHKMGFYTGLFLIALGSGGIKPCVSAYVGDQFDASNHHLLQRVFGVFYWMLNFGSFFASLLIPLTLKAFGPSVAFGIPGVLMLLATWIFWLGRKHYVQVPPTGKNPHTFLKVVFSALRSPRTPGPWLDGALREHPPQAVEGAKAVFRLMSIFLTVPLFWALFEQKGSTWVVQASKMNGVLGSWHLQPSQLMALNPLLVMLLIPLNEFVVYPALARRNIDLGPLRRMTWGMVTAGVAFVLVAALQWLLERGLYLSILWQAGPYVVLTLAEVLVSVTGLEFAYSQAPKEMKSTLMALWSLTVTVGNLFTAAIARLNVFEGADRFLFYAVLIWVAAFIFQWVAKRFVTSASEERLSAV